MKRRVLSVLLLLALILSAMPATVYATDDSTQDETAAEAEEAFSEEISEEAPVLLSAPESEETPAIKGAVPGETVTSRVDMKSGETKTGSFTIGDGGVVFGPQSGTAAIQDGTVTNEASNRFIGGVAGSRGSAFIARTNTNASLTFNNVTIDSAANTLPINIWKNASINAEGLTLNGPANASADTVFMLVGAYPSGGGGSLNYSGTNTMSGIAGTIAGPGGVINVKSGTLTVKDSTIKLAESVGISVASGANLVLDGSALSGAGITVSNGATMTVTGSSSVSGTVTVQAGGTLILDNAGTVDSSVFSLANGATLTLRNGTIYPASGTGGGMNVNVESGAVYNVGSTQTLSGVLRVTDATVSIPSGKSLTAAGNPTVFSGTSTISGPGEFVESSTNFTVENGTTKVTGAAFNPKNANGVTIRNGGNLILDQTTVRPDAVASNYFFRVEDGSSLTLQNGSRHVFWVKPRAIDVLAGGTLTIKESEVIGNNKTAPTIYSAGTVVLDGATVNPVHLCVTGGTLTMQNGTRMNNAKLTVASGATASIKDTSTVSDEVNVSAGGTLDISESDNYTPEDLPAATAFENNAILKIKGYTLDTITVTNGLQLTLKQDNSISTDPAETTVDLTGENRTVTIGEKTVKLAAVNVTSVDDPMIVVESGGTLIMDGAEKSVSGDQLKLQAGSNLQMKNAAVLNVNEDITLSGGLTAETAMINVADGKTLTVAGIASFTGENTINGPGTLENNGTFTVSSGVTAADGIRLQATHSLCAGSGAALSLKDCTAAGNANYGDGLVNAVGGTVILDGGTYSDNTTGGNGGVIWAQDSVITIKGDPVFTGNSAANGGVVWDPGSTLTIESGRFISNMAGTNGGALCVDGSALIIEDGVTFTGNNAWLGGAVYMNNCVSSVIGAALFEANGVVWVMDGEEYDIPASKLTHDGGALYVLDSEVTLNGTRFNENMAYTFNNSSGGAIYANGSKTTLNVNGAKFTKNYAGIYGGAMTVAHGAQANIRDLNGDPTEFIGNTVEFAVDFAGGGLFINVAYVYMEDAAIYNNYAQDAGGGLATCTTGTAQVRGISGAAVFNNHTDDTDKNRKPDGKEFKDVYFQTKDHVDHSTGEEIPGREGFFIYSYELFEHMFNGGLHRWTARTVEAQNDQGNTVYSLFAQSDPTVTDVSGAKVIFTENTVSTHPEDGYFGAGGAIGCNGLLEIGTRSQMEIKIVKIWEDGLNAGGTRPEDLISSIHLYQDGTDLGTLDTLSATVAVLKGDEAKKIAPYSDILRADDGSMDELYDSETGEWKLADDTFWVIVVSGLEKDHVYTVTEDTVKKYDDPVVDGLVIFNKLVADLTVTKEWADDEDRDGIRPKSILVQLMADGAAMGDPVALNRANNWSFTWEKLIPYLADGTEILYTVAELAEDGVEEAPEGYTAACGALEKDEETGAYSITVTNTHEPEKTKIPVRKIWTDQDNLDGSRPAAVTVKLLADDEDTGLTLELNSENQWKAEFADLPKYRDQGIEIKYTIVEAAVEGYEAVVLGNAADGFIVENRHTPKLTEIRVFKVWDDEKDKDGKRPESITVMLQKDGKAFRQAVLNEANGWQYTFSNLLAVEAGKEILYTIQEPDVPEGYTSEITGDMEKGFVIVNAHTPEPEKTELKVYKVWDDGSDADQIRPAAVTVNLLADGAATGDSVVLSAANDWMAAFADLPAEKDGKPVEYTVAEVPVAGYTSAVVGTALSGFSVINTHTPEEKRTSVPVTKVWNDNDNADQKRPGSITVKLLADGEAVQTMELSEAAGWKASFTDLPVEKNGKTIVYTVEESAVEGYTAYVSGNAQTGFTIVNQRTATPPSAGKWPPAGKTPKTGDHNNMLFWTMLALAALAGICGTLKAIRKPY